MYSTLKRKYDRYNDVLNRDNSGFFLFRGFIKIVLNDNSAIIVSHDEEQIKIIFPILETRKLARTFFH